MERNKKELVMNENSEGKYNKANNNINNSNDAEETSANGLTQHFRRNGFSRPLTGSSTAVTVAAVDHHWPEFDSTTIQQSIKEIVVLPSPDMLDGTTAAGGDALSLDGGLTRPASDKGSTGSSASSPGAGLRRLDDTLHEFCDALRAKIVECQQIIDQTSVVSFTANLIESRVLGNMLGSKLVKLYDMLDVNRMEDFDRRLNEHAMAATTGSDNEPVYDYAVDDYVVPNVEAERAERAALVADIRLALEEWDQFIADVERQLDVYVGPEKAPDLDSTDDIHLVSHNKMFRSGTLLSYLKKSAYEMIFLEIVTSFLSPECYQHVKLMFESLGEFQKNNCDILLLTKRPTQDGGGFLKLIGIPFRILLNEKESLKQLLAHRRSAISLAGVHAIHGYAEFASNEHAFEVDQAFGGLRRAMTERPMSIKSDGSRLNSSEVQSLLGSKSGCALVNRRGHILFSHFCQNNSDWPDIDELMEHVKKHQANIQLQRSTLLSESKSPPPASGNDNDDDHVERGRTKEDENGTTKTADVATSAVPTAKASDSAAAEAGQPVTVYRKKCCTLL